MRILLNNFKREITNPREVFGGTFDGVYTPIEDLQGQEVGIDMPRKKGAPGGASHIILSSPVSGSKIRDTLDGSEPDQNSRVYDKTHPPLRGVRETIQGYFFS